MGEVPGQEDRGTALRQGTLKLYSCEANAELIWAGHWQFWPRLETSGPESDEAERPEVTHEEALFP